MSVRKAFSDADRKRIAADWHDYESCPCKGWGIPDPQSYQNHPCPKCGAGKK